MHVFLQIKLICLRLVAFAADYRGISSSTFVIKTNIDVYLKLILIQINIVVFNLISNNIDMAAVKHIVIVHTHPKIISF